MHLPRLRLRLRTLLIAVAVAGLALGVWKRREYCLARATHFDDCARRSLALAERASAFVRLHRATNDLQRPTYNQLHEYRVRVIETAIEEKAETANRNNLEAAKYREIAARYRHVARYPWLPMPRGQE